MFYHKVIHGSSQSIPLPDKSVQCVVTSPPYWGLRNYETENPEVWGGDDQCEHKWKVAKRPKRTVGKNSPKQQSNAGSYFDAAEHATCEKCGAWRGQLGQEPSVAMYVEHLVTIFREVKRVLRDDGVFWLNLGDTYASGTTSATSIPGIKPKDLIGVPWMVAFALRDDGWYLRCDVVWAKPNPMPESVLDRPTRCHEFIFMLTKSERYYYDIEAVREPFAENTAARYAYEFGGAKNEQLAAGDKPTAVVGLRDLHQTGRNKRDVWVINSGQFKDAHFAVFPEELPETCIKASTSERGACAKCGAPWQRIVERTPSVATSKGEWTTGAGRNDHDRPGNYVGQETKTLGWEPSCECDCDKTVPCLVLDPFGGAATTAVVAKGLGRSAVVVEPSSKYVAIAEKRLGKTGFDLGAMARAQSS